MKHMLRLTQATVLTLTSLAIGQAAMGAVSAEEADKLGKALTPVGAEKAGNKAGTIPEWDGGLCKAPSDYKPKSTKNPLPYVDPFAKEKPLYTVTASNVADYKDKLAIGTQELLRRNPGSFRLDVYPTHRTACLPNWVYEATKARINNPKLVANGIGLTGAYAQIPFPIPKSGPEVMWNFMLAYAPVYERNEAAGYFWDTSGNRQLAFLNQGAFHRAYWDPKHPLKDDEAAGHLFTFNVKPVAQYGNALLASTYLRLDQKDTETWLYVPGQRRVRLAPELHYDTVQGANLIFFADEYLGFQGRMDKFDFKLLGKKEMIVPYNNYRQLQEIDKVALPHHANPDTDRWELHRVWAVEATLKPGQRHVQKRKVFYFDEDSWQLTVYDSFDQSDKIHHYNVYPILQEYDKTVPRYLSYQVYDMSKGAWYMHSPVGDQNSGNQLVDGFPNSFFTPDAMVRNAAR